MCILCGVCARCLCGPCRGMVTTVSVVEMFCFFDAGKSLKIFPKMIESGFVKRAFFVFFIRGLNWCVFLL